MCVYVPTQHLKFFTPVTAFVIYSLSETPDLVILVVSGANGPPMARLGFGVPDRSLGVEVIRFRAARGTWTAGSLISPAVWGLPHVVKSQTSDWNG